MADFLKNFVPGESIKASETNSNNEYILDQIKDTAATLQQYLENEIAQLQGSFFQAGFIVGIPHTTIPTGFLKCDGSVLLRADYEELFNAIGTIYGSTDSTNFKLPDFRGKFLRGYGGQSASIGTAQGSGVPNITGTFNKTKWDTANGAFYFISEGGTNSNAASSGRGSLVGFSASRSSSVYQSISEVRVDNYAVNWVIKY